MSRLLAVPLALLSLLLASLLLPSVAHADDLVLRVASYNVFGVPVVASDHAERVAVIAERLRDLDPDVVLLQELWLADDAAALGDVLEHAGITHHQHFPAGGLWVGSRYPVSVARFQVYGAGQSPWVPWHLDWVATKGVAQVSVDTPVGALMVANTHLQSSYAVGDYRFVQLAQMRELSDWLGPCGAEACDGVPPLIVAGDLNATPDALSVRLLEARSGAEPSSAGFDLDHLMHRSGAGMRVTPRSVTSYFTEPVQMPSGERKMLSDHPCLLAEYTLSPCADCTATQDALRATALDRELDGWVDGQRDVVSRSTLAGRFGGLLALLSTWIFTGAYPLRRRGRVFPALLMALIAAWLIYLGFVYGPYESAWLDRLHSHEAAGER